MKMQANIWRRCTYLQQMREPESKSKQVVRDCDIPGRGRFQGEFDLGIYKEAITHELKQKTSL